jgi:hypothetical protein
MAALASRTLPIRPLQGKLKQVDSDGPGAAGGSIDTWLASRRADESARDRLWRTHRL